MDTVGFGEAGGPCLRVRLRRGRLLTMSGTVLVENYGGLERAFHLRGKDSPSYLCVESTTLA